MTRKFRWLSRGSLIAAVFLAISLLAAPAAHAIKADELVKITSAAIDPPLKAGTASTLKVAATVVAEWHINSDKPFSDDYIPTKLEIKGPVSVTPGAIKYPPAETMTLDVGGGDKISVFGGDIKFEVPLKAAADFAPKPGDALTVTIDYQGCNNNECLRPASVSTTIALAAPGAAAGAIDGIGTGITKSGGLGGGDDDSGAALAHIFSNHGWFLGFLAVFLGGLALNLTPCVYPLIGVTIAYFGNQGGGPRRVMYLAMVFVLGIALMFSAVGVAVAMSGGLFGAAMQNPFVLVALSMMLLTLAASSFGLFSVQPPQWMLQRAGTAHPGYAGALLMGLGMGVVAAPCIGPIVLGLLLMVERSGSALFGFALFFTLALGLGVPYIGLAMAAGHIRRLPRSGEWLAWVEHLFGFILVGLALYFLDPVVPNNLMTRFLPYYAARRRDLSRLHFTRGPELAPVPDAKVGARHRRSRGAGVPALSAKGTRKTSLRAVQLRAARVCDRSAQTRADRFQRRLVYSMPRDGAFDFRRSIRGQRSQSFRPHEGQPDQAGQKN